MRSRRPGARCLPAIAIAWMLAGCEGSTGLPYEQDAGSAGGDKNLAAFIGTWQPTSGGFSITCGGQLQNSPVTENTVWQAGTTSDLVQPADSPSTCLLLANVSGSTATGTPNQTCGQTTNGVTVRLTLATYAFVLDASSTTATETATGTIIATGAASTSCTFTESTTFKKAS